MFVYICSLEISPSNFVICRFTISISITSSIQLIIFLIIYSDKLLLSIGIIINTSLRQQLTFQLFSFYVTVRQSYSLDS